MMWYSMNLVSKKNFKWYITAVVLFSVVLFAMCVYMVSWIPLTIRSPYSGIAGVQSE